jgi:hypothetical protein
MRLTLLLDPDLSKLAPYVLSGLVLAVVLPALLIWAIYKACYSKGAAQRRALIGLVLVVVALLLCRPLIMLGLVFLPR